MKAIPTSRRMMEVVRSCVKAAEDRLLLEALPPARGDVLTSSMVVAFSPQWLFWLG